MGRDGIPKMRHIDSILRQTLTALEMARGQVFDIAQDTRDEYARLERAVKVLQADVARCTREIDQLDVALQSARRDLAQVNHAFERQPPERVAAAYRLAEERQVALAVAQERARTFEVRGADLERSLGNLQRLVKTAEGTVSHMDTALDVLSRNADELNSEMEDLRLRFQIGERIIWAQEEERRRVAREIHDGPAQTMANVVLRAEICERLMTAGRNEVVRELAQLKLLVKDSLREVRKIIFNLRPMALDDLGLVPTLNRFLENVREQEQIPIRFEVVGEERRLHSAIEVAVFRMIQEAVNNARRHSQATHIVVKVSFGPRTLRVCVKDDGTGFDLEQVRRDWADRESFGLMSMKERIELLDGEFDLKSVIGKGTAITAHIHLSEDGQSV